MLLEWSCASAADSRSPVHLPRVMPLSAYQRDRPRVSVPTARDAAPAAAAEPTGTDRRLALLLAMAMFVLVVDTSIMNVSISAVVHDLDVSVSGIQSAIALEALVSAAFILIGSKIGDLIGRKRAYIIGFLRYAGGARPPSLPAR